MKEMYVPDNPFLSGTERFTSGKADAGFSITDYWSWAFSDLYNNVYRGDLAEFIVALQLLFNFPLQFLQCFQLFFLCHNTL